MTTLIDFILDLFRSPDRAAAFVLDPDSSLRDAGLPNVTAAQLQAVAATAAPAGLMLGGGDPVYGLQKAVASHHNIASPFSPTNTFAPQTQTDFASHNNVPVASNNDLFSPDQAAGANAQNGAFNLGFGDITLGDKTTTSNTATNGGVVSNGDSSGDIVTGDGAVLGNNNDVNNGDVLAGTGSNVNIGEGSIEDNGTTATGGSTVIQDNEGPVISDVDMSGGSGGGASSSGGGSLVGIGNGGNEANGGGGGGGGSIILTDSHDTAVAGNQTTVGHDLGSGNTSVVDTSTHSTTTTVVDTDTDNSVDDHSYTSTDDSFTSNVASGNSTDIASHNDTASHNSSSMDAF